MDVRQRLQEFFRRLGEIPPFSSHDEALEVISRVLTAVEDEYSGVDPDPSGMPKRTDGRMYPPIPAFAVVCDIPGVTLYMQRAHQTYIGANGAVLIVNRRSGISELDRQGNDGGKIVL